MENNHKNSPKSFDEDKAKVSYKFSFYKAPIRNITPYKDVLLKDVYQLLISDKYKVVTTLLREAVDKTEINEIKASKLGYATFSGVFSKRSREGLIQHSNLFCIDLDDLKNIVEVKATIISLLPPSLMFTSPSGNGLKIIYKITVTESDTHLKYFNAFEQFFKQELNIGIDEKCKDIPRACYLCYDENAYYNHNAEKLDSSFIDTFCETVQVETEKEVIHDYDVIIKYLKTWLNKKEQFFKGNRNNYITQLAGAYNRFGIPRQIAEKDLLCFVQPDFKEREIKAITNSIYKNTGWHKVSKFEINTPYDFTNDKVKDSRKEQFRTPLLPIEGFPSFLQDFINDYVDVYGVPRDYIAASIIFSIALAIGNKLKLIGKYENVPVLWLAIVGDVSTGKTEPLSRCLDFFNKKDNVAFKKYEIEKRLYQAEQDKPKKERDSSLQPPSCFQYLLNDYTPEALARVHTVNSRGLCVYRDELKGWLDDFGRYTKSGEQSNMLTSFYCQPMKFNRVSAEPISIEKPYIYVSGGIQPDLLETLANDSRAESGFLSRFIFAYPDLQIKQNYSKRKLNLETLKGYQKCLEKLTNINDVVNISLSNEAEIVYEEWYNKNVLIINNEPTGYLKGVYGKLDVISLRLAIVVHAMNNLGNEKISIEISERSMLTAIDLTEYFRATAIKVFHKIFTEKGTNLSKKDVAKYCSSLGASQNDIAKALKVSQQYVQRILKSGQAV